MVQVIFGEKGAGKTKRIISIANECIKEADGSIVFIDHDSKYMYDLKRDIRFVNASDYRIDGPKMFFGFICGIAAQDFDLENLFIDGFRKIVHHELATLEGLFADLVEFSERRGIRIIVSINCRPDEAPDFLRALVLPD